MPFAVDGRSSIHKRKYDLDRLHQQSYSQRPRREPLGSRLRLGSTRYPRPSMPNENELRNYLLPVSAVFEIAGKRYASVTIDPSVMGGAPCIVGTRIPVYMILDAIEETGDLNAALKSYPRLTLDQIRDAVGFAKAVLECPIEHET